MLFYSSAFKKNSMRTFVVRINHKMKGFSLNNLPEERIDLAARVINSALWLDHDVRRDTRIVLIFDNATVEVRGDSIRGMRPDERSIAGFLKGIIQGRKYPGIIVSDKMLEEFVEEGKTIALDINGEPVRSLKDYSVFILGDDKGLAEKLEGVKRASLGKKSYLASHCITIINYLLDKEEEE